MFESSLSAAYTNVTGSEPLEEARTLLQRLPGLTARDQQEGGRSFVDQDMLDALRGGAVARFVVEPYVPLSHEGRLWQHPLGELGCSLCGLLTFERRLSPTTHITAAREALKRWDAPTLALDCVLSAAHRPDLDCVNCDGLVLKEGYAETLDLEHFTFSNIELQWCHIRTLNIGDANPDHVKLYHCMIERLIGVADERGLPGWLSECIIGEFDSLHTNAAILRSNAPLPVRVLLTVLRKLFMQKGRARKETAFYRGLDQSAAKLVPKALELIGKFGIAERINLPDGTIWHPHRNCQARVQQIVATLGTSNDPLVRQAWDLK